MAKKKILFVSYGGGHVHMLAPLILEAQKDHRLIPHTIGLTIAADVYRKNYGISCEGAKEYLTERDADARRYGLQLLEQMQSNGNHVEDGEETIAYLGLSFSDLVNEAGSEAAAWACYKNKGRAAFLPLTFMRRVFDRIQPDLVITTNSPRGEKAAQQISNERNIPSILLTDLFNSPPEYNFIADTICVLSDAAKQNLMKWNGTDPSKIAVTGNPAFDSSIAQAGPVDFAWRKANLGVDQQETLLLWADQPVLVDPEDITKLLPRTEDEVTDVLDALRSSCTASGITLLVRPHPSQDLPLFEFWCRKNEVQLVNKHDLNALLRAVDIVSSSYSTVLLQAYFIGRTVLQLSLGGGKDVINIRDWPNVYLAENTDDLPETVPSLISTTPEFKKRALPELSTPKVMEQIFQALEILD